jgi:hypothetical protein
MGTRCDEFLSTLGLPFTSALLLSHTNAASEWMTAQQWRRVDRAPSQTVIFNVGPLKSEVNLNNT